MIDTKNSDKDIRTFIQVRFHQYTKGNKEMMSQNSLIDFVTQYHKTKQQKLRVSEGDIILEFFHANIPLELSKQQVFDFMKKLNDAKLKSICDKQKQNQPQTAMPKTTVQLTKVNQQQIRFVYQLAVDYFFKKYDYNFSGTLDVRQFTRLMNQIKQKINPEESTLYDEKQIQLFIKSNDPKFKGTLDKQTVLKYLKKTSQEIFSGEQQNNNKINQQINFLADFVFKKYDADNSGFLDLRQLTNFSNDWRKRNGKKQKKQSEVAQQLKNLKTKFPEKASKDEFIELLKIQMMEKNQQNTVLKKKSWKFF